MNTDCRESGDSFHVDYTVKEDAEYVDTEQVNLTHVPLVDSDEIAEREEKEFGWICQFPGGGVVELLAGSCDEVGGWDFHQRIQPETAEQLGHMFLKAAATAKLEREKKQAEINQAIADEEAERQRIASLQQRMPFDETHIS